jgi:hypothetical protein
MFNIITFSITHICFFKNTKVSFVKTHLFPEKKNPVLSGVFLRGGGVLETPPKTRVHWGFLKKNPAFWPTLQISFERPCRKSIIVTYNIFNREQ